MGLRWEDLGGGYWRVAAALPEPIRAAIRRRLDG